MFDRALIPIGSEEKHMYRSAAALVLTMAAAASAGAQTTLPNGFAESPQRSPQIDDFIVAVKMMEKTEGDPAYAEKLKAYRACSEAALRTLVPYRIDPQGAMIYTAVRQCTRPLDDYVLMYGADERFRANQYVGHAIMRMTQQEEIETLKPVAARLQPFNR